MEGEEGKERERWRREGERERPIRGEECERFLVIRRRLHGQAGSLRTDYQDIPGVDSARPGWRYVRPVLWR